MRPRPWPALIMLVLLVGCAAKPPISTGGMNVHFCHLVDCEDVFMKRFADAEHIACAFYELDGPVEEALAGKGAHIIIDDHDHAGIATASRTGEGIMHLKACVLDHESVITGSYNPTTSMRGDYNNLLFINATPIARHYEDQLAQLTDQRRKPSEHNEFLHDGRRIEVYACPQDGCQEALLEELRDADVAVQFLLFTFTDRDVADTLLRLHERGLDVTGVVESFQSERYNQYYRLRDAGVPVLLETSPLLQHNKCFIIDHETVITGSYNPTRAAATVNDETLIIIHDEAVAAIYEEAFAAIHEKTQSFK